MILDWVVLALLIGLNALYVAAEFAVVAVQRSELAPLARGGNRWAAGLLGVVEDGRRLDRYIAACQIGITLTSLVAGAYGQATLGLALGPWLAGTFGVGEAAGHSAAFLLVLLVLTTFQVVLAELVPKSLALQFPLRTALATYLPLLWSVSLYGVFIGFFNGSAVLLVRPFGVRAGGHQHVHSPEEIELLLAASRRGGALTPDAHRRLGRGLHLSARSVRQMMTPRSELYAIEESTPPEEFLHAILESPYSRVPVFRETLDQMIGAVSTKDVVASFVVRGKVPPLEQLLRPIPFVPDTLRAHRLVRFLQERNSSKAVVVDEFGGVQGIISMEDVLGELFGDIGDELKHSELGAEVLPDGRVKLPGAMGLDEAEPLIGVRWDGAAATVSGHVVAHLGRLPVAGESLTIDGVEVTVHEMSPTAVRWLVVTPVGQAASGAEDAADETAGAKS